MEKLQKECEQAANEICPNDSISNTETGVSTRLSSSHKGSRRSSCSSKSNSSVQLACIQIEAERAALVAQAESLKARHETEQQLETLQKHREQMDINAKIAASNAKLSVPQTFEQHGANSILSDRMESYFNSTQNQKLHQHILMSKISQKAQIALALLTSNDGTGFDCIQHKIQRQHTMTDMFKKQQKPQHLPPCEIPVF